MPFQPRIDPDRAVGAILLFIAAWLPLLLLVS